MSRLVLDVRVDQESGCFYVDEAQHPLVDGENSAEQVAEAIRGTTGSVEELTVHIVDETEVVNVGDLHRSLRDVAPTIHVLRGPAPGFVDYV